MDGLVILAFWIIWGLWGYKIGTDKGYGPAESFIVGVLLGPLTFLLYFATMKGQKCPHCGEVVKKEATVCRYCHSNIGGISRAA